jgi:retron-type reverse transcriptase
MSKRKLRAEVLLSRPAQADAFRRLLDEAPDLKAVFSNVDPYSTSFRADLEQSLREALSGNLKRITAELSTFQRESAIRHLWATAVLTPLSLAILYRYLNISEEPELQTLASSLLEITPHVIEQDPIARAIAIPPTQAPNLSECQFLMPGIRIRYGLASRLAAGAKTSELVEAAMAVHGGSDYVRRRELHRLVEHCDAKGLPVAPFAMSDFLMRTQKEHQLLCTSEILVKRFVPQSLQQIPDLKLWLTNQRVDRASHSKKLSKIIELIQRRDFGKIGAILSSMPVNDLSQAVAASLISKNRNILNIYTGTETPQEEEARLFKKRWRPLPAEIFEKLRQIFPKTLISEWWTWNDTGIAGALANNTLSVQTVPHNDRFILSSTWNLKNQRKILKSGLHEILNPNSKVWLEQDCSTFWDLIKDRKNNLAILARYLALERNLPSVLKFLGENKGQAAQQSFKNACRRASTDDLVTLLIGWAGTKEWAAAGGWELAVHPLDTLDAIDHYLKQSKKPKNIELFRLELAAFLVEPKPTHSTHRWRSSKSTSESLAAELVKSDPEFLPVLVKKADQKWLKEFIDTLEKEPLLLLALQPILPAELKEDAFKVRVQNEADPTLLHRYLVEGANQGFAIPWNPNWIAMLRKENGRSPIGATIVVLALRHNLKYLKRLCKGLPPELVSNALKSAVNSLSEAPGRDKALMELVAAVGIDVAPSLAAAVAMCDRKAKPGHRIDHGYYKWSLPKKSGGTRTISAPCPLLKKTQRALLDSLFNPLGVHPAAFGFVQGRSIKGNAAIHVGQKIVANVDVKNCFPSVRWPLVLGAIRRDLGERFSAAAIGLLVDLCTAEGGLPIGAPTSPALLNRVLHISDEILSKHAEKRGCKYSRYADDLSFSGDHGAIEMIGVATSTLQRIGLELDPKKTNIFRRGRRQVCTGLVVNVQVSVPRTIRRRLRAAIHAVESGREPKWHGSVESLAAVGGRLAYLQMVHFEEGTKLQNRLRTVNAQRRDADASENATGSNDDGEAS